MKIMHELINFRQGEYVKVKWDEFEHFTFPWHFHYEYEIVYILESFGKRFVGDKIEKFDKGDLVLLGSKLPHFWRNDHAFYQNDPTKKVKAIIVHFASDFIEKVINDYHDLSAIKILLLRASRGIVIEPPDNITIGKKITRLLNASGVKRFLLLMDILNSMASAKNYHILATIGYENKLSHNKIHDKRLIKIIEFINRNYINHISLCELADKYGFNSSYLSRYFKKTTGKSFVSYINELRINYACRLLTDNELSVTQICYECGFNNLSHFYRTFKKIVKMMPNEYKHNVLSIPNDFH